MKSSLLAKLWLPGECWGRTSLLGHGLTTSRLEGSRRSQTASECSSGDVWEIRLWRKVDGSTDCSLVPPCVWSDLVWAPTLRVQFGSP